MQSYTKRFKQTYKEVTKLKWLTIANQLIELFFYLSLSPKNRTIFLSLNYET
jgi:hypothetical protein